MGNENLFAVTLQGLYPRGNELRIDIINDKKTKKHVKYANFHIVKVSTKYSLHVSGFTGDLFDRLKGHNKELFSAFDAGNDGNSLRNCAFQFCAGWWFHRTFCYNANLKGFYCSVDKIGIDMNNRNIPVEYTGIHWLSDGFNMWDDKDSLLFAEMKVRRKV